MLKWIKNRLPAALILTVVWSIARMSGVDFSIDKIPGIVLTCFCFVVLVIEFNKSGDITLNAFGWDLGLADIAKVLVTIILTLLISEKGFSSLFLTDYFMGLLIIFDGWFSPFNSFRIALRNFMVGGTTSG